MPFSISNFLSSISKRSSSGKELSDSNENPPGPSKVYDFNNDWENNTMKEWSEGDLPKCLTPKFTYGRSKVGKKSSIKNERNQVSNGDFNSFLLQTSKNVLSKPQMQNVKRPQDRISSKGEVEKLLFQRTSRNQPTQSHQIDCPEKKSSQVINKEWLFTETFKNNPDFGLKITNYQKGNEDTLFPKSCLKEKFKYSQAQSHQKERSKERWGVKNESLILSQNQNSSYFNHYNSNQNESLTERRRANNLISASNLAHRNLSTPPQRHLSNHSFRNGEETNNARNGLQNLSNQKAKYDFKTYRNGGQEYLSTEEVDVRNESLESDDLDKKVPMHLQTTFPLSNKQKSRKKKLFTPGSESEFQSPVATAKLASVGLKMVSPKKSSLRHTKKKVKPPKTLVSKSRKKSILEEDKSFVFKKRKLNKAEEILEEGQDELASKRPKMSTSRRVSTRAKKSIDYKEEKSDAESLKNQAIKKQKTKDVYNIEEISDAESSQKKPIKKKETKVINDKEDKSNAESAQKKSRKTKEIKVINDEEGNKEVKSNAESVQKKPIKKTETKSADLEHEEVITEMKNDGNLGDIALEEYILNSVPILISSEGGDFEDLFVSTEYEIVNQAKNKIQDDEIILLSSEGGKIEELQQQKPERELMDLAPNEERIPDVQGNDYMAELQRQEPQKELIDSVLEEEDEIPGGIQVQPKKDKVLERICSAVEEISTALHQQNQIFELMIKLFLEQNNKNH